MHLVPNGTGRSHPGCHETNDESQRCIFFSYRKLNQYRISADAGYKIGLHHPDGIKWKNTIITPE
jgi:hypothetical protein